MLSNIQIKSMSSLEKCFLDEALSAKEELTHFTVFQNQRLAYQIGVVYTRPERGKNYAQYKVRVLGDIAKYATVRRVVCTPSTFPCNEGICDRKYLRFKPGLFPDLLQPLHYEHSIRLISDLLNALWVEVKLPENYPAGTYSLTVELVEGEGAVASQTVDVRVLDEELPPQRLIHTEWFYTDCIADHYKTRVFSERHWKLIENFLRRATENGINMILTPIFTPELDTYVGGERTTTQLLDITVTEDGEYIFGFERVDRWIDLCLSLGVKYFEIPHFFTQWGAKAAPKFVATVKGKKKKIFGWETDAHSDEYKNFLAQLIPSLVDFLEKKGVARNTFFHISDEPHLDQLEQYLKCKELIEPYIKDYPIIDALSNYEFYEKGVLKKPVPTIRKIDPFIENKVEGLWAYYCGDSGPNITGRQFAMPACRTRILGVQLWLNNIEGFLHWGYNFYNNYRSYDKIDPFLYTDAEFFVPSGDSFLVYPGDDGTAWESIRINALREAMEDMRLLDLCAERIGREATEAIVTDTAGYKITFTEYPMETNFLNRLRDRLIEAVEQA